ncbi:MAG: hypothetical protein WCO51_04510 [bacterium]
MKFRLVFLFVIALTMQVFSQTTAAPKPTILKPDVMIITQSMGPDAQYVVITYMNGVVSKDQVQQDLTRLSNELKSEFSKVEISTQTLNVPGKKQQTVVSFYSANLIEPTQGIIRLQGLARAFASNNMIQVIFNTGNSFYAGPTEWDDPAISLISRVNTGSSQFYISFKTHDPAQIVIPELKPIPPPAPPAPEPKRRIPLIWPALGIVILASIGAFVIVFYGLQKGGSRG